MINLKHVSKTFGNVLILNNVSFDIDAGDQIVIVGESGCGKSTLLRLILGFEFPDSGHIYYKGYCLNSMTKQDIRVVRSEIGILFQSGALFDSMTVGENVVFGLCENNGYRYEDCYDEMMYLLKLVDMEGFEDKMPSMLSGGQRKRIGLARTLALKPKCILFDEPTTGLDPILSTSIENLINKLNNDFGITTVVVSHQLSTILRTGNKAFMLNNGNLDYIGNPKNIDKHSDDKVRAFFSGNKL